MDSLAGEGPDPEVPLKGKPEELSGRTSTTPIGTETAIPIVQPTDSECPVKPEQLDEALVDSFGFRKLFKGTQDNRFARFKSVLEISGLGSSASSTLSAPRTEPPCSAPGLAGLATHASSGTPRGECREPSEKVGGRGRLVAPTPYIQKR